MAPPILTVSPSAVNPTIEDLLRRFEDYTKTLSAFQEAHPASDDGQFPFAVIGDEIALMATRRDVLTRLKRNLLALRNAASERSAPRRPTTPEPLAGPSTSGSLPTPPSGPCADLAPAALATIRPTGSLIHSVHSSPTSRRPAAVPTPAASPFRPLEREDAFYGLEMLKQYDFARGRSGRTAAFAGADMHGDLTLDSCDPQKPSVVAVDHAPALSTSDTNAPSGSPNPETAVVTRVTRASARRIKAEASASSEAPSSDRKTHGRGKKRRVDDVDAEGEVDGGANLPPAKRRKRLSSKSGGASI